MTVEELVQELVELCQHGKAQSNVLLAQCPEDPADIVDVTYMPGHDIVWLSNYR